MPDDARQMVRAGLPGWGADRPLLRHGSWCSAVGRPAPRGRRGHAPMSPRKPNKRSSIHQGKDGRWHGWVTMGVKSDGSPDRRHRRGATEAEVTRKVRLLERQRDSGMVPKPGYAPTVEQWMSTYLDTICARLVATGKMAPRTLDDYRSKAKRWIIPGLGTVSTGCDPSTSTRCTRLWPRRVRPTRTSSRCTGSCHER